MLIWIANIPEESAWYVVRMKGGWTQRRHFPHRRPLLHPVLRPALSLAEARPSGLAVVAVWMLVVHYVDIYWLVMPAVVPGRIALHWTHLAAFVGVGRHHRRHGAVARQRGTRHSGEGPVLRDSLRYTQAMSAPGTGP